MANEQNMTFPDLPVAQWWTVRSLLKGNLPKFINVEFIMGTLKISESTARNTVRNLGLMGLIDKDGKLTERANHWRGDDLYQQVCKEILSEVYPSDLIDIAQASQDRSAIENWFARKTRIGATAAKKNAAIFEVIFQGDLTKNKEHKEGKGQVKPKQKRLTIPPPVVEASPVAKVISSALPNVQPEKPKLPETPPNPSIHIDIQIHISPNAPAEQIEQIFASIEKHLYQPRPFGNGRSS